MVLVHVSFFVAAYVDELTTGGLSRGSKIKTHIYIETKLKNIIIKFWNLKLNLFTFFLSFHLLPLLALSSSFLPAQPKLLKRNFPRWTSLTKLQHDLSPPPLFVVCHAFKTQTAAATSSKDGSQHKTTLGRTENQARACHIVSTFLQ